MVMRATPTSGVLRVLTGSSLAGVCGESETGVFTGLLGNTGLEGLETEGVRASAGRLSLSSLGRARGSSLS